MIKLQILGTGCAKCKQLTENTEAAAKESQLACTIEKITEITDIMKFGVMSTPALVLNGKVLFTGKVPSVEEIKKLLTK